MNYKKKKKKVMKSNLSLNHLASRKTILTRMLLHMLMMNCHAKFSKSCVRKYPRFTTCYWCFIKLSIHPNSQMKTSLDIILIKGKTETKLAAKTRGFNYPTA